MSQFVAELLAKSTFLLLIPIGLSLLRSRTSADTRSKLSIIVLIAVAFLPFSTAMGPDIVVWHTSQTQVLPGDPISTFASDADNSSDVWRNASADLNTSTEIGSLASFASTAYILLTFLALSVLALRYQKTNRAMRNLVEVKQHRLVSEFEVLRAELCLNRKIRLCWQETSASTITWGVFKPTVGLPADFADWPISKRKAAFLHEISHVVRKDFAALLFARLIAAFYWWHPLSWLLVAHLKHDIECATDDRVLDCGIHPKTYARYLVEIASRNPPMTRLGIAMASNGRTLSGRISALISTEQRRRTMSKKAKLFSLITGIAVVSFVGTLQVAAALPSEDRGYIRLYSSVPVYPPDALKEGVEGYVDFEFDINASGGTENIRVLNQVPKSGVFEQSATEAMRTFRYLPKIEGGKVTLEQGVKMRLQFSLDPQGGEPAKDSDTGKPSDLSVMSKSLSITNRDLKARLRIEAQEADRDEDGERFLDLAEVSYLAQPELASYFLLRATQIGTKRPEQLAMLKAMTLYELGDMDRALILFTNIAESGSASESKQAANWIARIDYQIKRRQTVYDELMSQRQY